MGRRSSPGEGPKQGPDPPVARRRWSRRRPRHHDLIVVVGFRWARSGSTYAWALRVATGRELSARASTRRLASGPITLLLKVAAIARNVAGCGAGRRGSDHDHRQH